MSKNSTLVITDRLHFIGGAETYVKEFASIFRKYGRGVDCLTYYQDFTISTDSNINMLTFQHGRFKLFKNNISRMYAFIKKVNQISTKKNYKYIFLHLYYSPFLIFLFNFFPKSKRFVVVHGIRHLEITSTIGLPVKHKILGKIKRMMIFGPEILFYKYIQRYSLKKCWKIITLSQYAKNQVINNFGISPNKITIIPGAIDNQTYKPVSLNKRQLLKERLGFSKHSNLVVLVSRIEPRKNILAAIQSMKIITKKIDNVTLLIVSPAQDQYNQGYLATCYDEVSKNELGKNIVFTTGIDNQKTIQYYQCADLALTISNELETFGYTLIEALACGTPVVGTNVGNIPFILSKIDNKLIAKPIYNDIAEKVVDLLKMSKKEKALLIKKCSKEIRANNNYKLFMEKYQTLLYEK